LTLPNQTHGSVKVWLLWDRSFKVQGLADSWPQFEVGAAHPGLQASHVFLQEIRTKYLEDETPENACGMILAKKGFGSSMQTITRRLHLKDFTLPV
jgi:hypothetical protein